MISTFNDNTECCNIAVLITCHNRKNKTIKCLDSLFNIPMPDNYRIEVFLVDDGSNDGTREEVLRMYPNVNVILGDGNLFWNRGMNLAWKTAVEKGDFSFYFWLNDDVELQENSIEVLLKDFISTGNFDSIITGACRSVLGDVTYSGYIDLRRKRILKPNGEIQKCEYFNGNIVLISDTVYKQIGFLETIFHHGQGDFDYGLRAKKKGINSWVSSEYVGICERNTELPKWCNPVYPFSVRWRSFKSPLGGRPKSTFIFQRKYIGLWTAIFHYFTIHLRLLFPQIWKRNENITFKNSTLKMFYFHNF